MFIPKSLNAKSILELISVCKCTQMILMINIKERVEPRCGNEERNGMDIIEVDNGVVYARDMCQHNTLSSEILKKSNLNIFNLI